MAVQSYQWDKENGIAADWEGAEGEGWIYYYIYGQHYYTGIFIRKLAGQKVGQYILYY